MNFNRFYDALPYDITRRIRQNLPFLCDKNDGKDSFYVSSSNKKIEIRISNHCTHLWTWHERPQGNYDDITRISIVFEEYDTFDDKNLVLKYPRHKPLKVMEYVYRISNPQDFTPQDVLSVINEIKRCVKTNTSYIDKTNKLTYSKLRISINPDKNNIKEYKNMNKNKIRLTESQLHNLIKESVMRVLREHRQPITIGNNEYGEEKFYVEIGNADLSSRPFVVFAYNEQEALDLAVDYCEQNGMSNVFWDDEEEAQEFPDEFITAGNHCHLLRSDCVIVRKAH